MMRSNSEAQYYSAEPEALKAANSSIVQVSREA